MNIGKMKWCEKYEQCLLAGLIEYPAKTSCKPIANALVTDFIEKMTDKVIPINTVKKSIGKYFNCEVGYVAENTCLYQLDKDGLPVGRQVKLIKVNEIGMKEAENSVRIADERRVLLTKEEVKPETKKMLSSSDINLDEAFAFHATLLKKKKLPAQEKLIPWLKDGDKDVESYMYRAQISTRNELERILGLKDYKTESTVEIVE